MIKRIHTILFLIGVTIQVYAQDPGFSQFFSSPLNINPALTATMNADWRLLSNMRDQWIGTASPYMTGTISFDKKLFQQQMPHVAKEKNVLGAGGMLMFDRALNGAVKSTFASLTISYNMLLSSGGVKNRLGVGFGAIYGRRYLDFSGLDFQEQFTGVGFNNSLPTGESALSVMKPYFSSSAGIVYSISTEKMAIDIGASAFHLNRPRQTFLEDDKQYLAMRKVAHINFEAFLSNRLVLNTNGIYQSQSDVKYISVGGAIGYYLEEENELLLNAGLWYWSNNALIPYVGLLYKNFQFGLSYDIPTSKLAQAARKPNTWEVSIIFRGTKVSDGVIPCPWK